MQRNLQTTSSLKVNALVWLTVMALLVGGATAATAITKRAPAPDISWGQSSNFVSTPFGGGFEPAIY